MDEQGNGSTPESGPDSPPSAVFHSASNRTSTSSPRHTSRRAILKRVVIVPFKNVKGESGGGSSTTTPSDSWAWRKYGQKPIKGSHYPRGYYRCSSSRSNGCPARKQVERSHEDPSLLIITYSREHNHPCPASKRNHKEQHHNSPDTTPRKLQALPKPEERFSDQSLTATDEFHWLGNMEASSSTIMDSPILAERCSPVEDADTAVIFPMGEEEESVFADLEELPECSVVFDRGRGGVVGKNEPCRSRWCGTKS